jgi:hypothetical protein
VRTVDYHSEYFDVEDEVDSDAGFSKKSKTLEYVNVFQGTTAWCTQPAYTYMRTRILEPWESLFVVVVYY